MSYYFWIQFKEIRIWHRAGCRKKTKLTSALSDTFMWEDMTNYVGQREQFVDNCGPQNEAQNETHCAKVFKMIFDDELVELIVQKKTLTQHKKYKPEVSFHCVLECWTGNLSLIKKKCMLY